MTPRVDESLNKDSNKPTQDRLNDRNENIKNLNTEKIKLQFDCSCNLIYLVRHKNITQEKVNI